jgi:hypothetical protein
MEYPLGYREIIPDQSLPEKWKDIILNTGEIYILYTENIIYKYLNQLSIKIIVIELLLY